MAVDISIADAYHTTCKVDKNPVAYLSSDTSLLGIWKNVKEEGESTQQVAAFLGVPYAEPPVGELRFAPPMSYTLWKGHRKAQKFGAFCPQNIEATRETYFPMHLEDNMSEDCLYLNVWTPSVDKSANLPVMVWIHGGSYVQGCSNYFDGTALAGRHNIVHVSFNYRVGPFGFMCMDDERIRGNMGLLDQIEVLKWVRRHITSFGGDRDNITVFGESVGAICISMLLTSPLVRGQGFFKRAIMQSGSCFYQSNCRPPHFIKGQVLEKLKVMGAGNICTGKEVVEFLQDKSASEIISSLSIPYAAVVDGVVIPVKSSILYEAGKFEPVETIIGFNTHEGAYFVRDYCKSIGELNAKTADDYLRRAIFQNYYRFHDKAEEIYQAVYKEYLHGVTDRDELYRRLIEMISDIALISPAVHNARTHSGKARTYMYQFDHRPFFTTHVDWVTADHWDEVPYVFGEPFLGRMPEGSWSKSEQDLSVMLMKYWTNFAKTGDPNGEGLARWPVYQTTSYEMLVIGDISTQCSNFNSKRMSFWLDHIEGIATGSSDTKSQL